MNTSHHCFRGGLKAAQGVIDLLEVTGRQLFDFLKDVVGFADSLLDLVGTDIAIAISTRSSFYEV